MAQNMFIDESGKKWQKVAKSGFTGGKATLSHFEPLWKSNFKNPYTNLDAGRACLPHAKNRL